MPIQTPKINLQPQTSFRQVRLTSSEGDRALANFTANVGESLGQMNKAIEGRIHENLKLQGERAGITADNADQLRQDSGARAQAYNEGFMSSYLAKLDMDTSAKFQELSSKYANQPAGDDGLEGAMDQYIQTVVGQTPEGAQPEVEIALRRKAVVVQSKANTAFQERQRNDHKSTLYASLEHNTQNLERIGVPQSDEDIVEFQTYFAQANESINSLERANLLLPGEAAKERLKLKERLEVNTAKQMLMQDENPILLASQIATKSTGDEYLDNMRPDTVTKLVTFAQQLDTAQQTVENRKRKRDQDIRDVAFVDVSRSVFENPADLKNPEKIEGLLDVAQTQEELNQVMKLKKFMTESGQEKYQNSNPSTLQQVTSKVRTLDMTQEELDSLHGQGLSTSDYLSLSNELESGRNGLMGTPAVKLFKDQLSYEFPVTKVSPMEMLMAQISGQKLDQGNVELNSKRNEQIMEEALIDLQEAIVDGQIQSRAELRVFTQQRIAELKQTYGGRTALGKDGDVETPGEQVKADVRKKLSESTPGVIEDASLYPTPDSLMQAVEDGTITEARAKMIFEVNKEKYANGKQSEQEATNRSTAEQPTVR